MPIKFTCLKCDKPLTAPDHAEGKIAPCPKCSHKQKVPPAGIELAAAPVAVVEEEPVVKVRKSHSATAETKARRVRCPHCGEMIVETAVICRFCGESVDDSSPVLGKKEKKRVRRDLHLLMEEVGSTWRWVSILIGVLGILAIFVGLMLSNRNETHVLEDGVEVSTSALLYALGGIFVIGACIGGLCSWGCFSHYIWAVYLGLVLGYLQLLDGLYTLLTSGGQGIILVLIKLAIFSQVVIKSHQAAALSWRLNR